MIRSTTTPAMFGATLLLLGACTTESTSHVDPSIGGGSTGGASTGDTATGTSGGVTCEGQDYTEPTCEGPNATAQCADTFEAQVPATCANVDGLEFTGEHGDCGDFAVTRHGGFYNSSWCFYDIQSHVLVGAIYCDDTPRSCGGACERTGDVALCCAALPTVCSPN